MSTVVSSSAGQDASLWTAEGFLSWLAPGVHADLIDGEKFMRSPVSLKHARFLSFLDEFLRGWLRQARAGGELFREVVTVKLEQRNVFLPDLRWFDAEQAAALPDVDDCLAEMARA